MGLSLLHYFTHFFTILLTSPLFYSLLHYFTHLFAILLTSSLRYSLLRWYLLFSPFLFHSINSYSFSWLLSPMYNWTNIFMTAGVCSRLCIPFLNYCNPWGSTIFCTNPIIFLSTFSHFPPIYEQCIWISWVKGGRKCNKKKNKQVCVQ